MAKIENSPSYSQTKSTCCIEVGGNDGVTGSNTFHFEQLGWTCILVEPIPWMFDAIRRNRKCRAFQCAASDRNAELELNVSRGAEQLASVVSSKRSRASGGPIERILVRTRRLDEILDEAGVTQIDFASIDVEGHEYGVLQGFTFERFRPRILIVEASLDQRVERHLVDRGYVRFDVTGVNDWYARPEDPAVDSSRVEELRRERREQWRALGWRSKFSQAIKSVLPDTIVLWLQRLRDRIR